MEVRRGLREDLDGVTDVLQAAFYSAYAEILRSETIAHALSAEQSPAALKRRVLQGRLLVALEDGKVIGCGTAEMNLDHVFVPLIAVDPKHRQRGVGGRIFDELCTFGPGLPVCINVLLGSVEGEHFVEKRGFVPGETIERVLGRQEVVERRWWLAAS